MTERSNMNKFVKGYLIGKLIELTLAGGAVLIVKHLNSSPQTNEASILAQRKKAIRKRLSR